MNLLKLRLKKLWSTKVSKHFWPSIPFEIAFTDISDSYENYPGMPLAEFNFKGHHYIIYVP